MRSRNCRIFAVLLIAVLTCLSGTVGAQAYGDVTRYPRSWDMAEGYISTLPAAYSVPHDEITYSAFLSKVNKGEVREVSITQQSVIGESNDGRRFRTVAPRDPDLIKMLITHGVRTRVVLEPVPAAVLDAVLGLLPILTLFAVLMIISTARTGHDSGFNAEPALGGDGRL